LKCFIQPRYLSLTFCKVLNILYEFLGSIVRPCVRRKFPNFPKITKKWRHIRTSEITKYSFRLGNRPESSVKSSECRALFYCAQKNTFLHFKVQKGWTSLEEFFSSRIIWKLWNILRWRATSDHSHHINNSSSLLGWSTLIIISILLLLKRRLKRLIWERKVTSNGITSNQENGHIVKLNIIGNIKKLARFLTKYFFHA